MKNKNIVYLVGTLFIVLLAAFLLYETKSVGAAKKNVHHGSEIPNATFSRLEGGDFQLNSVKEGLFVLCFFSTSCHHCQEELEKINEGDLINGRKVKMFFIGRQAPEDIATYIKKYPNIIKYSTVLSDTRREAVAKFALKSVPTFLIYKDGVLVEKVHHLEESKVF